MKLNYMNSGTAAFPIWEVWTEPEDENGFMLEHLAECVARFLTKQQAKEYVEQHGEA